MIVGCIRAHYRIISLDITVKCGVYCLRRSGGEGAPIKVEGNGLGVGSPLKVEVDGLGEGDRLGDDLCL